VIRIAVFFQFTNLIAFELEEEMETIDTFGFRFSVGKPTVSARAGVLMARRSRLLPPRGLSMTNFQVPSAWRRTTSALLPDTVTGLPSASAPVTLHFAASAFHASRLSRDLKDSRESGRVFGAVSPNFSLRHNPSVSLAYTASMPIRGTIET